MTPSFNRLHIESFVSTASSEAFDFVPFYSVSFCFILFHSVSFRFIPYYQNRDGFIDKEDLHDMLASLGKDPTDEYLEAMMNEAPGAINFTMFLTLFGERLQGKQHKSKRN